MLIKLLDHLNFEKLHSQPVKGYVVDNEDPEKLGRVKCYVKNRWEADKEKLPWVYPLNHSLLGGRSDLCSLVVPEKDSELIITFPFNDEYSPFYVGYWITEATKSKLYDEDYPETYGFTDSYQWLRVNKKQPYTEYYHKLKQLIRFDDQGNLSINLPKDMIVKIAGDAKIEIGGKQIVKTSSVSLQADSYQSDISGNIALNAGGIMDCKASNVGLVGAAVVSLEAPAIHKNSGITFGIADAGKATVSSDIGALSSSISELQAKVDELQALYDELQASIEQSKQLIKEK